MSAHHINYPNTPEQIFKTSKGGKIPRHIGTLVIDEAFLWSLGEMRIPKHLWRALTRFASWIEPSLISEWIELMRTWNSSLDYGIVHQALTWHELEHDTTAARSIAAKLLKSNSPIYCVWSGKRLQLDSIDIDHCFPFSAWPCADLWNLMPADRRINQEEKRHKLPTAQTFEQSKERMLYWWQHAYFEFEDQIRERFISEGTMALPLRALAEEAIPEQVFEAMLFKRAALKQDLQLPDWHFSSH